MKRNILISLLLILVIYISSSLSTQSIIGNYENDQRTVAFASGNKYFGQFKHGKFYGKGTQTSPDGFKYDGQFKEGMMRGQGTYTFSDGTKYVGQFEDDKFHGQGILIKSNGEKYVGQWIDNKFTGK